jgi:hypothetical protein
MIEHMLIRKDENICKNLNKENIASFLASCIPTETFEEPNEKINYDEDPVRIFYIFNF